MACASRDPFFYILTRLSWNLHFHIAIIPSIVQYYCFSLLASPDVSALQWLCSLGLSIDRLFGFVSLAPSVCGCV